MKWDGKDANGHRCAAVAPGPEKGRLLLVDLGRTLTLRRQHSPVGEAPDGRWYSVAARHGNRWLVNLIDEDGRWGVGSVYPFKDDAIDAMVEYAVSQLNSEDEVPDVSKDVVLQANSVGVTAADMQKGPGVRVMMTSSTSEGVVVFDMYPSQARRHAMRILQSCEMAEGRGPVNG